MTIQFNRIEKTARYLDPRYDFQEANVTIEIRRDPLTGRSSRIAHYVGFQIVPPDINQLIETSKANCPFCPERVLKMTPQFPSDMVEEGRIQKNGTVIFPNLSPYDKYSAVAVISEPVYRNGSDFRGFVTLSFPVNPFDPEVHGPGGADETVTLTLSERGTILASPAAGDVEAQLPAGFDIDSFAGLLRRRGFDPAWITAFLDSMEMDLDKRRYQTMDELLEYIHDSAEVIGLMMARVMGLPDAALPAAQMLGRAMQYINFIRDIHEDLQFGRIYFPLETLQRYGLSTLDKEEIRNHPDGYVAFVKEQIHRYCTWQETAEKGFHYIRKRYLIPVKTASEMYKWTAHKIRHDPFVVYRTKVKPLVPYIVSTVLRNVLAKPLKVESCSR